MAAERSWLTPYNFVQNNPIIRIDLDGRLDGGPGDPNNEVTDTYTMEPVTVVAGEEMASSNESTSIDFQVPENAKDIVSGGSLSATMIEKSFKSTANQNPLPQRGVTPSQVSQETKDFRKVGKYAARVGNVLTGAELTLASIELAVSDKSAGDYTEYGVRVSIVGISRIPHPLATLGSIGLGLAEANGAFDEYYNSADLAEQTGILVIPNTSIIIPLSLD